MILFHPLGQHWAKFIYDWKRKFKHSWKVESSHEFNFSQLPRFCGCCRTLKVLCLNLTTQFAEDGSFGLVGATLIEAVFVSSNRSSYSDDVLFCIFRAKIARFSDFHSVHWCNWCIDVGSVTLSCFDRINAIDFENVYFWTICNANHT